METKLLGTLDYELLGNSIQGWLIALAVAIIGLIILYVIKRLSLSRFIRLTRRTENIWDDAVSDLLSRTRSPFIGIVSLFLGSLFLSLATEYRQITYKHCDNSSASPGRSLVKWLYPFLALKGS
jgi:uncharacterized membrane-anchored protein YhcB (DUF1043 family)